MQPSRAARARRTRSGAPRCGGLVLLPTSRAASSRSTLVGRRVLRERARTGAASGRPRGRCRGRGSPVRGRSRLAESPSKSSSSASMQLRRGHVRGLAELARLRERLARTRARAVERVRGTERSHAEVVDGIRDEQRVAEPRAERDGLLVACRARARARPWPSARRRGRELPPTSRAVVAELARRVATRSPRELLGALDVVPTARRSSSSDEREAPPPGVAPLLGRALGASSSSGSAATQSLCAAAWSAAAQSASARTSAGDVVRDARGRVRASGAPRSRARGRARSARAPTLPAAHPRPARTRATSRAPRRGCRARARGGPATGLIGPASSLSALSASSRKRSAWRRAARRALPSERDALERVLSHRLQHREPHLAVRRLAADEAPADERLEIGEELASGAASARASSRAAAVGEYGERAVELALARRQAPVAPVDRGAQRSLALGKVDRALHLEREALVERAQDLRRREDGEARGDELDREREAVEPAADLAHRRERVVPQDRRRARRRARRTASSHRRSTAARAGARARSTDEAESRLVASTSRSGAPSSSSATCTAAGARCSKLSRKRSAPVPFSESAIASTSGRSPDSRTPIARAIAFGTRLRIRHRGEPDEVHGPLERGGRRHLERESALARPARAGDRDEPDVAARRGATRCARGRPRDRRVGGGARAGSSPTASAAAGSRRAGRARGAGRAALLAGTSFRRWRPSGRYEPPGTGSSPAMSRVARETTTCSPWAAAQIRDATTTSMPTYPSSPSAGSPVWMPIRRRSASSGGHGSAASARCISATAASASPRAAGRRGRHRRPPSRPPLRRTRPQPAHDLAHSRSRWSEALAEEVEQPRRPLDVGEDECHRACRQVAARCGRRVHATSLGASPGNVYDGRRRAGLGVHFRAVFDTLSDKLQATLGGLGRGGRLDEEAISKAMREIRLALLEADVNLEVARDFTATVKERALGQDVLKSLTPGQQVVKIVHEELTALMGSGDSRLAFGRPPTVILLAGLQGSGRRRRPRSSACSSAATGSGLRSSPATSSAPRRSTSSSSSASRSRSPCSRSTEGPRQRGAGSASTPRARTASTS